MMFFTVYAACWRCVITNTERLLLSSDLDQHGRERRVDDDENLLLSPHSDGPRKTDMEKKEKIDFL